MFKIFQCCTPTTKNLRTIPTFFSNSTPDPMKSTPVTGRGTYIGHAELSYHGPCHAFHLLQVTTSTWHCLMDDSTLKLINFVCFVFWLQIFHEFPMGLDISVGIFEGPLILRHTSSIHSHFGELFTSRRPPKQTLTWHDTVRIMGSQNWWFGHPRTLLSTVKPLYIGFVNDSYGSTN